MKKAFFFLALALVIHSGIRAQTAATKNWQPFWTKFTTAINKKDTASLRRMMADDFFDGGGGGTASQWLESMQTNNSWKWYKPLVAKGTKIDKCDVPCRSTKDGYLLFEYRKNKWLWVGLGGEGGGD